MGASGITGNHENSTSLNPPFEDYSVLHFRRNCSVICCGLEIMKVQLKFEEYPIRVVGLRRVNCSQLLDCLPLSASALESKSRLPRDVSLLRVRVKRNTNIVCVLRRCVSPCMQPSHRSGRSQFKVKGQSSYRNPRTMLCPCFSDHGYLWYWTMRWPKRQKFLLLSNKRTKGWPNDPTGIKSTGPDTQFHLSFPPLALVSFSPLDTNTATNFSLLAQKSTVSSTVKNDFWFWSFQI